MNYRLLLFLTIAGMGVAGCASTEDVALNHLETRADLTQSIQSAKQDLSDQHLSIGKNDLEKLQEHVKQANDSANKAIAESSAALKKALEEKKDRIDALQWVLDTVDIAFGGKFSTLAQPLFEKIESKTKELSDKIIAANLNIQAARNDISAVSKNVDLRLNVLGDKFKYLDAKLVASLSQTPPDVLSKLESLKGQDEAFRSELKSSLQLTAAQMQQLEGYSTEELLALIATAIGAAGAGGLLGKTGKSRAQDQIDQLRAEIGAKKSRKSA